MNTHWRQWVVSMLIVVIGLVFGAPLVHAQTAPAPEETQASAQVYEPLKTLDTGKISPLHPLLGLYQWDDQSYTLNTQADRTVVLSALSGRPQTITPTASNTYTTHDNVYRLKLFATGIMLILAGIVGLAFPRISSSKTNSRLVGVGPYAHIGHQ